MASGRTNQRLAPRPLGVVVLALIQILNGLSYLAVSLVLLALSSSAEESGERQKSGFALLLAIVYLILGIYALWLARGYIKGYEWARKRGIGIAVFAIVLLFIGTMFAKLSFFVPESPFWAIVGNLIIIWYLSRPKVRKYFASRTASRAR